MTAQRTQSPLLTTVILSIALLLTCHNEANARKEDIDRHTSKHDVTIVHDMQFLLSIAKLYSGNIDSICGNKTANAIILYMNTIHNRPEGDTCDPSLLKILFPMLVGDVSSGKFLKSHENNVHDKEENAISQSDIESIKNDIIKTRAEVSRIQNVIENNTKEKMIV